MEFVIVTFATFALATAVTTTDGPFNLFYRLRHMRYSKLFECFTCSAVWLALLLAIIPAGNISTWFILGVAGAGGAMFLEELADRW